MISSGSDIGSCCCGVGAVTGGAVTGGVGTGGASSGGGGSIDVLGIFAGIGQRLRLLGRQGIENAGDATDVAAEGGEALLQRLLIADVGQHLAAPGQSRRALAGQKQAGPGHQGRQAHTFQRHRFTAGVRASDRHHPQLRRHPHRHRHHLPALLVSLLPKQQRMAQLHQRQGRQGIGRQLRSHRPQPLAVAGPSQGQIQL